jgi:hypothetical protein
MLFILSLLGYGGATIFPSLLGSAIHVKSLTFELLICIAKVDSLCECSEAFHLRITDSIKDSPEIYRWDLVNVKKSPSSGNRFDPREEYIFSLFYHHIYLL